MHVIIHSQVHMYVRLYVQHSSWTLGHHATSLPTSSALALGRHCRCFAYWTPVLLPKPLAYAAHMEPVLARQPPNFFALQVLFLE